MWRNSFFWVDVTLIGPLFAAASNFGILLLLPCSFTCCPFRAFGIPTYLRRTTSDRSWPWIMQWRNDRRAAPPPVDARIISDREGNPWHSPLTHTARHSRGNLARSAPIAARPRRSNSTNKSCTRDPLDPSLSTDPTLSAIYPQRSGGRAVGCA